MATIFGDFGIAFPAAVAAKIAAVQSQIPAGETLGSAIAKGLITNPVPAPVTVPVAPVSPTPTPTDTNPTSSDVLASSVGADTAAPALPIAAAVSGGIDPMLIVAGVAGAGMLVLGYLLLRKSSAKAKVAGYRRRKRRSKR